MKKKENNNFDQDNVSKEIYIEKISEDRKRLAETFRKSTKEEFNKTYNDFLMCWKNEGYSTDNFISIKEIDNSEKIEALRDPLIVFLKKCCEDPKLINNLVEILKRGGKVNSNDKPLSIQNFSLLSILFYKDLTDGQRILQYGQEIIEEEKIRN